MVTQNSSNIKTAASGKVLQGQGVGTTSDFSTATYPATATGTGTILRADGTNWAATTATYPATTTINQILYSSANNTVSEITTAIDGVLITSHTGVPSVLANSGTAGFVLTANSGAPPSWQAASGSSPLTTKGDLYTYSTVNARLAVGTNNFALTPASGETTGLKWVPGPYVTRVAKSASYSVDASTDYLIAYTSTSSAYTVTLPSAPATGQVFIIKDESGAASINNIAITVSGGVITIDGSTTQYLNTNYGSVAVYFNGTNYFFM